MLHRAADLYFQSLGLEERAVIETADGLRYVGDQITRVSLLQTERSLVHGDAISTDRNRSQLCVKLNSVRNELIYTHGAGCPHREELSTMISDVATMVERVEGNRRWITSANNFFNHPQLDELAIFDAIADVDTFVEEIQVPDCQS